MCGYLLFHDYIVNKSGSDQNSGTVIDHGPIMKQNPVQLIKQRNSLCFKITCDSLFSSGTPKCGTTNVTQILHSRNCGQTGAREGLWDRLRKQMEIA